MNLANFFWLIGLLLIASFGLTLSSSLLSASTLCVTLYGLYLFWRNSRGRFEIGTLDLFVVVASCYVMWRISTSLVWDLAKEDFLLLSLGLATYWIVRISKNIPVVLAMSLVAAFNIAMFISQRMGIEGIVPMNFINEYSTGIQSYGLFKDYGAFGNATSIIGMMLISYAFWASGMSPVKRVGMSAISLLTLGITFFSGSRSAVVSISIAGLLLIVISWVRAGYLGGGSAKRVRLFVASLGCLALVLVIALTVTTFSDRDTKLSSIGVTSEANIRSDYWGIGFEQLLESPVFGRGARSFSYESAQYWEGSLSSSDLSPEFVHNEYLQVLAEYGWLGFILLLAVLILHWSRSLSLSCAESLGSVGWKKIAGLVGLTVVMVHSLTDFPLRLPFNLVLASICLAWCAPQNSEEGKPFSTSLKDKGLTVVLVLISAGVIIFSGREVWAATPLLLKKQAREDGAWSPVGHEDTLEAYELANERSPDFRRSQRIAQIYHLAYERGEESTSLLAEKFYKESLDRHPYNPVPLLNLANLYRDVGEYTKSEVFYDRAESFVSARDSYFKYYVNRAKLSIVQAEKSYTEGNIVSADKYLESAMLELKESKSDWKVRLPILRDCYVARVRMAVESESYEEAEMLWRGTKSEIQPWVLRRRGSNSYYKLGEAYCDAASKEWRMRKPELAKELYLKSKWFYLNDKSVRKGLTDVERDTKLEFVEQALRTLEEGGF